MSHFVPASVSRPPGAYNHHPTVNGRTLVARLRGSPPPRSPKQNLGNLLIEEYGPRAAPQKAPQRAYKNYYNMANMAKAISTQNKVQAYVKRVGASIPNQPELQRPSRPRYQGQKAGKTSINKVLHKYPELLPLFFKPNVTFSPIVTAYLQNRKLPGYPFFPDASGRYPNRTRRRRSRSSSSGSSSSSNGRSKSPKRAHQKQRAVPNRRVINMRNPKLEKTPSTNSTGNSVMSLNVGK
jgi:hypothetical protein